MAKRILVPIDADERSEKVVPVIAGLAHGTGSTVRLLRVFPVPEHVVGEYGRVISYVDQEMARLTAQGVDDLAHVAAQLQGVPVEPGGRAPLSRPPPLAVRLKQNGGVTERQRGKGATRGSRMPSGF